MGIFEDQIDNLRALFHGLLAILLLYRSRTGQVGRNYDRQIGQRHLRFQRVVCHFSNEVHEVFQHAQLFVRQQQATQGCCRYRVIRIAQRDAFQERRVESPGE